MKKSESIKEISSSLVNFNSKITSISKDAKNPQFRSEYVTLDKLILETRPVLQECGLSIMQIPLTKDTGEIGIQTILLHQSGEYIESDPIFMTPTRMVKGGGHEIAKDPQAAGSTISYLRRYSYQAILNLNTGEDDDGNRGSNHYNNYNNNNYNTHSDRNSNNRNNNVTNAGTEPLITQPQIDSMRTLMAAKGVDKVKMQQIVKDVLGSSKPSNSLTMNEATTVINHLLTLTDVA